MQESYDKDSDGKKWFPIHKEEDGRSLHPSIGNKPASCNRSIKAAIDRKSIDSEIVSEFKHQ